MNCNKLSGFALIASWEINHKIFPNPDGISSLEAPYLIDVSADIGNLKYQVSFPEVMKKIVETCKYL